MITSLSLAVGSAKETAPGKVVEMVDYYGKSVPSLDLTNAFFCYQGAESCPKKAIKNSCIYKLVTTDKTSLVMKPKHVILCQE